MQDAIELRRRPTTESVRLSVRFSNHAIALKVPSFSMTAAAAATSPIANGIHTKELDYLHSLWLCLQFIQLKIVE